MKGVFAFLGKLYFYQLFPNSLKFRSKDNREKEWIREWDDVCKT